MAADEDPARYLLKVRVVPLNVAMALPSRLTDVRDRLTQWEQRGPGSAQPLDSWDRKTAKRAIDLILEELNHYISLATDRGSRCPRCAGSYSCSTCIASSVSSRLSCSSL